MNIYESLSKLTIISSPNMKPFPYQEVSAIEREQCDLRAEISSLRIQLENAERCMISLERKRQNLINDRYEGNFFEQMFGKEENTLWDHLDRMNDTPMAEEVYGG